ncbi:hypothetical protein, partial [Vineibacter terrae]|uniref:hypothetical protein n=1 Tax=Vineibacter terrae TaxID=2586908 RepID=UPI002E35AD89
MAVSGILRRWAPLAFAAAAFAVIAPPSLGADLSAADYRFSGPYTHENLTIFLVHGKPGLAGKPPIT